MNTQTQNAKLVADQIASLAGNDISEQAALLSRIADELGMVAVVFTQNDCDEDVELDAIAGDLKEVLVTRGNDYIGTCVAQRS